jgi:hypothetical protein
MRPSPGPGTEPQLLLSALVDELVEAHLDTIEMTTAAGLAGRWECQLDYLRALVRTAQAVQAQAAA